MFGAPLPPSTAEVIAAVAMRLLPAPERRDVMPRSRNAFITCLPRAVLLPVFAAFADVFAAAATADVCHVDEFSQRPSRRSARQRYATAPPLFASVMPRAALKICRRCWHAPPIGAARSDAALRDRRVLPHTACRRAAVPPRRAPRHFAARFAADADMPEVTHADAAPPAASDAAISPRARRAAQRHDTLNVFRRRRHFRKPDTLLPRSRAATPPADGRRQSTAAAPPALAPPPAAPAQPASAPPASPTRSATRH